MDYEIKIKSKNGILSAVISQQKMIETVDGRFIPESKKQVAIGIGDHAADPLNPTEAELAAFRAKVDSICGAKLGKTLSDAIADATASQDQIAAAKADAVKAREDSLKAASKAQR